MSEKQSSKFEKIARAPYVRGLPEWELFPDEIARDHAIRDIERRMMPRSILGWLQFLVFVIPLSLAPFIALHFLIKWLHPAPFPGKGWVIFIGATLIYTIIIYLLLRGGMPRDLRRKLVQAGVPVCLKCGYDLRGLPADRTRCPECGRRFGQSVRRLLGDQTA